MDRSTKDCCAERESSVDIRSREPIIGTINFREPAAESFETWTFVRSWDHSECRPTMEVRFEDPGPAAALEGFPDTPEEHLGRIQRAVGPALAAKYRAGQREHGGVLSQKPGLLAQAEDEAIDQATYLCTLREQIERAALSLDGFVEEAIYRGGTGRADERIERALDILRAILEQPD